MTDRKLKIGGRTALGRGLSALISAPPVSITPSVEEAESNSIVAEPTANPSVSIQNSQTGEEENKVISFDRAAFERNTTNRNAAERAPNQEIQATFAATSKQSPPVESSQSGDSPSPSSGVKYLNTSMLAPNPKQPRQDFSDAELSELASSLKTVGLLQPILVRPVTPDPTGTSSSAVRYEIVAGERRWRAAQLAELTQVPVIIRELSDRETLELALIENLQRENLNPVEHAFAYQRLSQEFGLNQAEIAERVGKDRASVANFMRLLKLPEEVLALLRQGALSMGHAKAILSLREPAAQISLARRVIKDALSVRALESLVAKVVVLDTGKRKSGVLDTDNASLSNSNGKTSQLRFPEVTDRLRRVLGTKVSILHTKSGRGRIDIEYFSEEELDRLVDQLSRAPQQT